jgi:putative ABC transport system substrate-binding protein
MTRVGRRAFIVGTLSLLAAPLAVEAQQPVRIPRVAYVYSSCIRPGRSDRFVRHETVRQALRERGYIEGQNVNVSVLCAEETPMLSTVIADEVRLGVAVIVALGADAAQAAIGVTKSVAIVMISDADPVGIGLVDSLAHPGGNVTGVTLMTSELAAKRLELLREVAPRVSRVGLLGNPTHPTSLRELAEVQAATKALGLQLTSVEVRTTADLERAFATLTNARVAGLMTATDPVVYAHIGRIAQFAIGIGLPAVSGVRDFVMAGGLMSYEPSATESGRRAASYIDRILKGAKPADLPIEQPTKFELVINLKTAKALGLTIPPAVLARADEVIE